MGYIEEVEAGYDRYFESLRLRDRDRAESAAYEAWLESQPVIEDEDWEDEYDRAAARDEYDRF